MRMPRPPPPAAALTMSGKRLASSSAKRRISSSREPGALQSGQHRDARLLGGQLGADLVAEQLHRLGRRADEHDSRARARAREGRRSRTGSRSRGGSPRAPVRGGRLEHALDRQVGLGRRGRPDPDRLVGEAHVRRVGVGVGVDRDRADVELLERADDADRDLAAVGDQDGVEHQPTVSAALEKLGLRFSRNADRPSRKSDSRVLSANQRISSSSWRASSPSPAWRSSRFADACAFHGPCAIRCASLAASSWSSSGAKTRLTSPSSCARAASSAVVGQVELERAAVAEVTREEVGAAAVRVRRDGRVAEGEDGSLGGEDDVVGEHDPDASAADRAVDRGDRDLGALVQRGDERVDPAAQPVEILVRAVAGLQENVDRAADAPRGPVGADEDHTHVVALRGLLHLLAELARHRDVDRVACVGLGERQRRHAVLHIGLYAHVGDIK